MENSREISGTGTKFTGILRYWYRHRYFFSVPKKLVPLKHLVKQRSGLSANDTWLEMARMVPHPHPICDTSFGSLGASFMHKCGLGSQKSDPEGQKCWKMAILWLFLSHREMAYGQKKSQYEYLFAPMIWAAWEHFRMSGSIICRQPSTP